MLKAYAHWGETCVDHFNGMFAFAIWDINRECLFLARDRMGIKPLYYSIDHNRLIFASNTQSLLANAGVDTSINPVGLHHQLTLHSVIPAPHTILNGIQKVRPAHSMTFRADGRVTEREYWQLSAQRPHHQMDENEWTEAIYHSLKSAVKRQAVTSDVPVGVLLSGGLDSSLLVALLAESGVDNMKTFTVGFEDKPAEKGNEFEYSDQIAEIFGTEHHRFFVPDSQVLTRLVEAVDMMSEPMVGQDCVAFYMLAEQVSKHVKVVQSGQGADEVFGGYFWYPEMYNSNEPDDVKRFASQYFDRDHYEYLDTVDKRFHGDDHTSRLIRTLLAKGQADEYLDKVLKLDVTTLIVDDPLKRVDNMTMAWGLEARVPFVDHELVELAASMPLSMKLGSFGKHVLKHIAKARLPEHIIDRPKAYFPVPALKYIQGECLDFMRMVLLSDTARQRGIFNPVYVEKLLSQPERYYTRLKGSKLWHLALLELWLQRHVP
nr:N-acetylglutaminylglutamine amidotransferase [Enterovibrio nigricans]